MKLLAGVTVALCLLDAAVPAEARRADARALRAAKAHFAQGRAFYEAGAWQDAVREYEKAYALAPLPELQYNIGQAYRMKNDKPRAIAAYQKYLEAKSEGPQAEEARNHIATLKMKIQVEEAEAAKRKALEEAEAAKRKAREEAEARKRAEAEAADRARRQQEDQTRLRRLAVEEAQRITRAKEEAEKSRKARVLAAGRIGRGLRAGGITLITLGSISLGCLAASGIRYALLNDVTTTLTPGTHPEDADNSREKYAISMLVFGTAGAAILVTGIVLHQMGLRSRRRAEEAAERSVTVLPLLSPQTQGLALTLRF